MPSPFPGMDPYLERRNVWPDVHSALIVATRDALAPQVAPAYYVAIEERTYIMALDGAEFIGRPDVAIVTAPTEARPVGEAGTATAVTSMAQTVVLPLYEEVRERYLEIRAAQTHAVVTVIEVLSPSHKASGEGREAYEEKRRQVLSTLTNLVEIDLLRGDGGDERQENQKAQIPMPDGPLARPWKHAQHHVGMDPCDRINRRQPGVHQKRGCNQEEEESSNRSPAHFKEPCLHDGDLIFFRQDPLREQHRIGQQACHHGCGEVPHHPDGAVKHHEAAPGA